MIEKVLIFGGTSEGRKLTEILTQKGICVHLSVATQVGSDVLNENSQNLRVHIGRLNSDEISDLINKNNFKVVVDATHPYAIEVTENIKKSTENLKYIRLIREKNFVDGAIYVENIEKACEICKKENILLTTGSKQISEFRSIFNKNVYARVLPTEESIELCKNAGLSEKNIITHLGVCSYEQNLEIIKKYKIKTLITKESGKIGGFFEKYYACVDENVEFIVISRPSEENGYNVEEIYNILMENEYES